MNLHVLSAGAAKGLVEALQPEFERETGARVSATFGAVGAMREKLLAGSACDILILTAAMQDDLARDGRILRATTAPLGRVFTGIAVRSGEPHPGIADRATLRASLAAARGLYCPDPERATAGIHFVRVLRELGLWPGAEPRLRPYPSGAVAMGALAASRESGLVGCTQITEIRYTPGVELVGPLPPEFALATVYSVAVCTAALQPCLARGFAGSLAGPGLADIRQRGGFESS